MNEEEDDDRDNGPVVVMARRATAVPVKIRSADGTDRTQGRARYIIRYPDRYINGEFP